MNDSTSPVMAGALAPGGVTPPARHADAPSLAFADADGAKRWANGLPLTNVGQLYDAVLGQLRALSAANFAPRERATIAEVLRDQVAYLHTELARRYAGKARPAVDRELEAGEQAIALWHALWEQYSACLKPLLEGDPDLAGVKSKLLQRGLYVGKQLVVVYGLARRTPPPTLWQELHAYFRLAELLECAVTAVSDDLMANAVGISCYSTYTHALLLGLADPCAMSVKQIELTDRWLGMWSRKLFPYAQQRETEGPIIVVDLESPAGASLIISAPRHPPQSMRFGYPGKLATSVRGRLKRLQTGANPAELQLGHDCSVEQCTTLLGYLDARWYQGPRRGAEPAQHNDRTLQRRSRRGILPDRRTDVRAQGSDGWAALLPGRAAPPVAERAHRLRPRARGRGADVGLGAVDGRVRMARRVDHAECRDAPSVGARPDRDRPRRRARSCRLGDPRRPGCPRRARALAQAVARQSEGDLRPPANDCGVRGPPAAGDPARRVARRQGRASSCRREPSIRAASCARSIPARSGSSG